MEKLTIQNYVIKGKRKHAVLLLDKDGSVFEYCVCNKDYIANAIKQMLDDLPEQDKTWSSVVHFFKK